MGWGAMGVAGLAMEDILVLIIFAGDDTALSGEANIEDGGVGTDVCRYGK
jgi:hypothetical protein